MAVRGKALDLLLWEGPNPFRDTQAKNVTDDVVRREFFASSTFHSLFNAQHEILVGTRGSGKTILLRMMSFSNLLQSEDTRLRTIANDGNYIAFYLPLHLEVMSRYFGIGEDNARRKEYFQFVANCMSAVALLRELQHLVWHRFDSDAEALIAESLLTEDLSRLWLNETEMHPGTFNDLEWELTLKLRGTPQWRDGDTRPNSGLATHLFTPIVDAIKRVSVKLGISLDKTVWALCIDEAEFLDDPFLTCLNSFMRSNKRPLVLKIATLPFRHSTLATDVPGVEVQSNGDDFNYRMVDMDPSHRDFTIFTNHLVQTRMKRIGRNCRSLEAFLGYAGNDDPIDYYKLEVPPDDGLPESLWKSIMESLSDDRRKNYDQRRKDIRPFQNAFIKRFAPVYYVRRVREEDRKGARKVSWFAGPSNVRSVADGNPRRFLQLMNDLFDRSTQRKLTLRQQHEVVVSFASRMLEAAEGLPDHGPMTRELVEVVGEVLFARVHGTPMVDGGCSFLLSQSALEDKSLRAALQLACQYTHVVTQLYSGNQVNEHTRFRLAFVHAVNFWLPMRRGEPIKITPRHLRSMRRQVEESLRRSLALPFPEDTE